MSFALHRLALADALRRLAARPLAVLLALAPAALALAALLAAAGGARLLAPQWQRLSEPAPALAFVAAGTSAAELAALREQAAALPGVAAAEIVARDAALAALAARSPDGLLPPLRSNPLPDALRLRFARGQPPEAVEAAVEAAGRLAGIERMQFDARLHRRWSGLLRFAGEAGRIGAGALLLLTLAALLLAPRVVAAPAAAELRVLALVGADAGFHRRPYLYAGAVLGLLAAAFALVAGVAGAWLAAPRLLALGIDAAVPAQLLPPPAWLAAGAALAVAIGAIGGAWAARAVTVPRAPL